MASKVKPTDGFKATDGNVEPVAEVTPAAETKKKRSGPSAETQIERYKAAISNALSGVKATQPKLSGEEFQNGGEFEVWGKLHAGTGRAFTAENIRAVVSNLAEDFPDGVLPIKTLIDNHDLARDVSGDSGAGYRIEEPGDANQVAIRVASLLASNGTPLLFRDGALWRYDSGFYRPFCGDDKPLVTSLIVKIYASSPVEGRGGRLFNLTFSPATYSSVLACLEALPGVFRPDLSESGDLFWIDESAKPAWWTDRRRVLAVANGYVHLDTGEFTGLTPSVFCARDAANRGVRWEGLDTPCPEFEGWLAGILPDPGRRRVIENLIGYSIYGDNPISKIFILQGERRSGKGSVIRFMERLNGPTRHVATTMTELGSKFGIEDFVGKNLATYPDYRAEHGDLGNATQTILSLTGRDTISVTRKWKTALSVPLKTKLVIGTNTSLSLPDSSSVIATRMYAIRFDQSFADTEKPDLDAEIWKGESSGILAFAVRCFQRFVEDGFDFRNTEDSVASVEAAKMSATPLAGFIDECLTKSDESMSFDDVFAAFTPYLKENGNSLRGWTKNKLRTQLGDMGYWISRRGGRGDQVWVVKEVALTSTGEKHLNETNAAAKHIENQREMTQRQLDERRRADDGRLNWPTR
jgi:P4 family phage/plasmid primase-like protien